MCTSSWFFNSLKTKFLIWIFLKNISFFIIFFTPRIIIFDFPFTLICRNCWHILKQCYAHDALQKYFINVIHKLQNVISCWTFNYAFWLINLFTITSSALCRAIKYYNIFKIIDVASYFPELPSIFLAKEYYCMAILFVWSESLMS